MPPLSVAFTILLWEESWLPLKAGLHQEPFKLQFSLEYLDLQGEEMSSENLTAILRSFPLFLKPPF